LLIANCTISPGQSCAEICKKNVFKKNIKNISEDRMIPQAIEFEKLELLNVIFSPLGNFVTLISQILLGWGHYL
jgi:hypothetical protein